MGNIAQVLFNIVLSPVEEAECDKDALECIADAVYVDPVVTLPILVATSP
jgi:hypothetical protein